LDPLLAHHLAALAPNHRLRRDHVAHRQLPGLRRGASDDPGRPCPRDERVRVRHLRAGVRQLARGPGQRRHRGVLSALGRPHWFATLGLEPSRAEAGQPGATPACRPTSAGGIRAMKRGLATGTRRRVGRIAVTGALLTIGLAWLLPYAWMV